MDGNQAGRGDGLDELARKQLESECSVPLLWCERPVASALRFSRPDTGMFVLADPRASVDDLRALVRQLLDRPDGSAGPGPVLDGATAAGVRAAIAREVTVNSRRWERAHAPARHLSAVDSTVARSTPPVPPDDEVWRTSVATPPDDHARPAAAAERDADAEAAAVAADREQVLAEQMAGHLPHSARIYDAALGGKTNFHADREAFEQILRVWPGARVSAQANRGFLQRSSRALAQAGFDQFLDIGTGIPTEPNLHQVVQAVNPAARVVYVDKDPVVLAHAAALMTSTREGRTAYVQADAINPDAILDSPQLRATLDLSRPVAVSMLAVLHFLDDAQAQNLVDTVLRALAAGSAISISHSSLDADDGQLVEVYRIYADSGLPAFPRTRVQLREQLLAGLDLAEPGIALTHRWRADPVPALSTPRDSDNSVWAAMAYKPADHSPAPVTAPSSADNAPDPASDAGLAGQTARAAESGGESDVSDLPTSIDTSVAHPARVYDAMIGGKDNYAADRELAAKMTAAMPDMPVMLRANRDFLGHAVGFLAAERGIDQFFDIGSGIPVGQNVHEVAQRIDPAARVVYVDNDPVVLAHSRALLISRPSGRTAYIHADARDPEALLADPAVFGTLDRSRPIALLFSSVLMYFPDELAHHILRTLLGPLPPGSHLMITHPASDFDPDANARARAAGRSGGIEYHTRDHASVTSLFAGLDLLEPGVVPLLTWRPRTPPRDPRRVHYWAGIAVKPG